jgi:hypothetical protein
MSKGKKPTDNLPVVANPPTGHDTATNAAMLMRVRFVLNTNRETDTSRCCGFVRMH